MLLLKAVTKQYFQQKDLNTIFVLSFIFYYFIVHDNKRNSVSFKKYSSLDQPRIKVENVVNSRVKGSHHSSKDNEIIIKQNQNSKEQHMHGIRNSNNPNEGKIIHENKEHSVFVVGERINPSVNISSCQTQRNMDWNYNFNNLEPFNADSKGYSSREYGVERYIFLNFNKEVLFFSNNRNYIDQMHQNQRKKQAIKIEFLDREEIQISLELLQQNNIQISME